MNKLKQLNKKKWFIVLVILLAIALVGGLGTYAMFYWRSAQNTEITLKIGDIADVIFPNGQELNTNSLAPVFNYTDGETLSFSIKNKDTTNAYIRYTVNFNITNIDSALANTSLKYKLVSGNDNLAEGDFNNVSSNSTIKIARGKLPSGTSNYTLYIYIDSNVENDPNMMNKNIRGTIEVTAEELHPFNLAQHITNLYTNAPKTEVVNNNITYNYATSVDLMNDRLGGTTSSFDGGNIRYYGADITYLENSTGADGQREVGNWESIMGSNVPFSDSEGCNRYMQNNGITDERMQQYYGITLSEFCSTTTKYYKALKNYVDIGDKTAVEVTQGNWEALLGGQIHSRQECLDMATEQSWTDAMISGATGYATVDEFCSTTTIPAGTPILWRIIGVFDGKVRIRRDEAINGYSFDTSASNVNDGYGINQWGPSGEHTGADLMKLLNPGYESNQDFDSDGTTKIPVNNSLYWNSGTGKCYSDSKYTNTDCDFTNSGLSEEAKEYVVDQTVYLGGFNTREVFANEAYQKERGNDVYYTGKPNSWGDDTITRTLSWTGKVALIYPSDFGYAADFRDSNCQGNLLTFANGCTENWMSKGFSFTISPWAEYASYEMIVYLGEFYDTNAHRDCGGWPTLLLDSSVMALGTGTKDDPYVIG